MEPLYKINHLVSSNKLKAYIRVELFDKSAQISHEEILNYLKEHNIVYRIREKAIVQFCKNKEYSKELIAASGKAPIKGKDGEVVYNFDIKKENKFKEDKDGTIDFRNLNNVINVKKDTVLSYIIPPVEGKDGIDIYGNPISHKRGRKVSFNNGNNTYISKDGLQLLSSTDGAVEFKNNRVIVEDIYVVTNVDNTTGNIDFIGNVIINGDVKEGFSVTAVGDIKIRGMVEGAFIKSEGEVIIGRGMNGMGKGSIYSKGNITSKYIENATVVSEKSIYAEALINSEAKAGDSIIMRGSLATIIGGTCQAVNTISAKSVGNKTNPETNIILDLTNFYEEEKIIDKNKITNQQLQKELANKNKELKELNEKIDLIMDSSLDIENKSSLQKQLILMKVNLNNEIHQVEQELQVLAHTNNITNHKIVCKSIMYSNTRIAIGWMKYRVREDINHSKVYSDGKDILIMPLNPADLDI